MLERKGLSGKLFISCRKETKKEKKKICSIPCYRIQKSVAIFANQ